MNSKEIYLFNVLITYNMIIDHEGQERYVCILHHLLKWSTSVRWEDGHDFDLG